MSAGPGTDRNGPVQQGAPVAPSGGSGRIAALDVLRGIAIVGTLGTNIWIFTDPLGPSNAVAAVREAGAVELALRTIANGKLLALLTLMFGIGLELQYRSAVRRGVRWPGRYLWRAALLFVEGLLHYVLVFEYDVLMAYALVSMIVAYLIGRTERVIRVWIAVSASVSCLLLGVITAGTLRAPESGIQPLPEPPETWGGQLLTRLEAWPVYRAEVIMIIPSCIALFLVGALLLRSGAFAPDERGAALRRRLMLFGLGIGVPVNVLTAAAGPAWFFVDRYIAPPLVALGLLGLIPTVLARMRPVPGLIRRGLTAVGQAALSCYVFQNVLASVLCYSWGLGLAQRLEWARPLGAVALWLVIVATFMLLSVWWLRHFRRGPLEAAWQWAYELGLPRRRARIDQ